MSSVSTREEGDFLCCFEVVKLAYLSNQVLADLWFVCTLEIKGNFPLLIMGAFLVRKKIQKYQFIKLSELTTPLKQNKGFLKFFRSLHHSSNQYITNIQLQKGRCLDI